MRSYILSRSWRWGLLSRIQQISAQNPRFLRVNAKSLPFTSTTYTPLFRHNDSESLKRGRKRYLHPIVAWSLAGRVVIRYSAWIVGRVGIEWLRTNPDKHKSLPERAITLNRSPAQILAAVLFTKKIALFAAAATTFSGVVYFTNLEEVPITRRKRFNIFTLDTIEHLADEGARLLLAKFAEKQLPADHPTHVRVEKICRRLAHGASTIPDLHQAGQASPSRSDRSDHPSRFFLLTLPERSVAATGPGGALERHGHRLARR